MAHMIPDASRRLICHGCCCGESGHKDHLGSYEKPRSAVRATKRQAQGRILLDKLQTKNKRERFNPKKYGIRDPKKWRNLRWKFTALKKVVLENLGGDRDDAALLLKMLADCHAVNALGSSIETFGSARVKAMVIRALQQFFHEYTASKGTQPAEMQNAFDVVVCAVMSDEVKSEGLRVHLGELFNLRHHHVNRGLERRNELKDRKGWTRVMRKVRKDKRDLQVAEDYWHNEATRFDSFSPRKRRKWLGYKKYKECWRHVYYDHVRL